MWGHPEVAVQVLSGLSCPNCCARKGGTHELVAHRPVPMLAVLERTSLLYRWGNRGVERARVHVGSHSHLVPRTGFGILRLSPSSAGSCG